MANDFVQELKARVSVEDALTAFFNSSPAKRLGDGHLMYVCPFHGDKNASLSVDPNRGTFRCFGCDQHGDIFTIATLYKHPGLSGYNNFNGYFPEAIDTICEMFHIEKPASTSVETEEGKYYRAMKYLADSFNACNKLFDNKGYSLWEKRGFDKDFVDRYHLGVCYEPASSGALLKVLTDKFGELPYKEFGMVDRDGNSPFVNRLTIPIQNSNNKFVSFTARTFVDDDVKYKLMKTNKYYKKQDNLYLFNTCRGCSEITVVEGHIDALSLHKAGYFNAVALAGCKMSTQHTLLLDGKKIILALDNDDAGRDATVKILTDYPSCNFEVCNYEPLAKDFNDVLVSGKDVEIETVSDIEFYAMYLISQYTDNRKVVDMFVGYAAKKIAACKVYEDHRKLGINIVGLDNAVSILNKNCGLEYVDIIKILNKIYEF